MDAFEFLHGLSLQFPILTIVLAVLGSLVVVAQIVVALTPSQADDQALEKVKAGPLGKVFAVLEKFAPYKKK